MDIRELKLEDLSRKDGNVFITVKNNSKIVIDNNDYIQVISKYFDFIYEDTKKKIGYLMRTVHGYKFMEKRMGLNAMFAVGVDIAIHLKLVNPEQYGIHPQPLKS